MIKVFLSYSQANAPLASDLADRLNAEGFDVWFAARELFPDDNWPLEIGKALQRSEAMTVLLSPDHVMSPGLQHKLGYALIPEAHPVFLGMA